MSTPTNQPHANLFHFAFSLQTVAAQFLRAWLPDNLTTALRWDALEVLDIPGINRALEERREDIAYVIPSASGTSFLFYVVIEHQTTIDRDMPLRLLEYVVLALGQFRSQKANAGKMLPMVAPFLIYPGPGKWTGPRRLRELIGVPPGLEEWANTFLPDSGAIIIELSGLALERLANGSAARAILRALQAQRNERILTKETIIEILEEAFQEPLTEDIRQLIDRLWSYALQNSELQPAEIDEIVNLHTPEETHAHFMSTADMLMERGRQEGREEGELRGEIRGEIRAKHEAVLDVLELRFGRVPDGLREAVEAIDSPAKLHALHRAAVTSPSLDEFAESL